MFILSFRLRQNLLLNHVADSSSTIPEYLASQPPQKKCPESPNACAIGDHVAISIFGFQDGYWHWGPDTR